jgi:hypothetical protein
MIAGDHFSTAQIGQNCHTHKQAQGQARRAHGADGGMTPKWVTSGSGFHEIRCGRRWPRTGLSDAAGGPRGGGDACAPAGQGSTLLVLTSAEPATAALAARRSSIRSLGGSPRSRSVVSWLAAIPASTIRSAPWSLAAKAISSARFRRTRATIPVTRSRAGPSGPRPRPRVSAGSSIGSLLWQGRSGVWLSTSHGTWSRDRRRPSAAPPRRDRRSGAELNGRYWIAGFEYDYLTISNSGQRPPSRQPPGRSPGRLQVHKD